MKKITLDDIEKRYKINDYNELYNKVIELIENNKIKIIKSSGINGKSPALYNRYTIVDVKKDYSKYIEELDYTIIPSLDISYYKKNLDKYLEDRENVLKLNNFLSCKSKLLEEKISQKERSFQIWNREKYLEREGKTLLKRLGLSINDLNFYDTNEPLAYYSISTNIPMKILIVENMDTFYTIRKALMDGKKILEENISAVIYGRGKGILKAFNDFSISVDKYVADKRNNIFYFGDLDYEGIIIYETLHKLISDNYNINPFIKGYEKMIDKSEGLDLPKTKEKQNRNIGKDFLLAFDEKYTERIIEILEDDLYIPQEILNIGDL